MRRNPEEKFFPDEILTLNLKTKTMKNVPPEEIRGKMVFHAAFKKKIFCGWFPPVGKKQGKKKKTSFSRCFLF